jgi:hypothetical protein
MPRSRAPRQAQARSTALGRQRTAWQKKRPPGQSGGQGSASGTEPIAAWSEPPSHTEEEIVTVIIDRSGLAVGAPPVLALDVLVAGPQRTAARSPTARGPASRRLPRAAPATRLSPGAPARACPARWAGWRVHAAGPPWMRAEINVRRSMHRSPGRALCARPPMSHWREWPCLAAPPPRAPGRHARSGSPRLARRNRRPTTLPIPPPAA